MTDAAENVVHIPVRKQPVPGTLAGRLRSLFASVGISLGAVLVWNCGLEEAHHKDHFAALLHGSEWSSKEIEMMHWIWTIVIGFVAGLIAKAITPGSTPRAIRRASSHRFSVQWFCS